MEHAVREAEVRDVMWRLVGLFREQAGLEQALATLESAWRDSEAARDAGAPFDSVAERTASLVTVGRLIARAALRRHESRGAHFRSDAPARDDIYWSRHVSEVRDEEWRG
jgi:L-aspartate oxidase